jgi:predicted acyltransferase
MKNVENKTDRLMSLDTLRGADMLFIMGFSGALVALCQLLGFGKDCWLATQMTHVIWHGFRHHDTIFPLFLFLAGVAWPFSYASQVAKGRTAGQILRKLLMRVADVCRIWNGLLLVHG